MGHPVGPSRLLPPSWVRPPEDTLGSVFMRETVALASDSTFCAIACGIAYPTGCLFTVRVGIRRKNRPEQIWRNLREQLPGGLPTSVSGQDPTSMCVVSATFPDGSRISTVDAEPIVGGPPQNDSPKLSAIKAEATYGDQEFFATIDLWLWPLPLREPVTIALHWAAVGLVDATVELDGAHIVEASKRAQRYWQTE